MPADLERIDRHDSRAARILVPGIETPLHRIPVHIIQAPNVGLGFGDFVWPALAAVPRPEPLFRHTEVLVGAGATGIFPLRFGRKAVFVTRRKPIRFSLQVGKSPAICRRVIPCHPVHRQKG
jgi:hypothetical protein